MYIEGTLCEMIENFTLKGFKFTLCRVKIHSLQFEILLVWRKISDFHSLWIEILIFSIDPNSHSKEDWIFHSLEFREYWNHACWVVPGGGYFCQNCTWMCLPDLENFDFPNTNFSHNILPTHQYTILERKAPRILLNLGAFCHNLLKIHPIYVLWAVLSLMKIHRSLIPYFTK